MIHPSLKARIVLVSIFTALGFVICLLPSAKYQHAFLRLATSSAGAFGVVLSIATLANIPVWREVWSRLWIAEANGWGSSIEKGLSTVYCVLLLFGCSCDWFLHRKLGENPDEVRAPALGLCARLTFHVEMGQLPGGLRLGSAERGRPSRNVQAANLLLVARVRTSPRR